MESIEKYSDQVMLWLREMGYSHCFYVAGGNIMHLLHSAGNFMTCIPVIHEVAAGIAVEYYNEMNAEKGDRAFALVTAGPGLTNIVTAIAGAYMESRELLVIGGQVKSSDLSRGEVRQRGIQEIDGVKLVESITKESISIHKPLSKAVMMEFIEIGQTPRKGPVFL
jgi:acetolactate synthase-1/2/3 large subunit